METYCVSCKTYNANENSSVRKTKQSRLMILSFVLFMVRKNKLLLKARELIVFQMINLK